MKPGLRYMEARDEAERETMREGRLFRPTEWPESYVPSPNSNDDLGQRRRFGYLRGDGMWMRMPAPGHHDEAGMSEWYLREHPEAAREPKEPPSPYAGLIAIARMREEEARRPWWKLW